MRKYHHRILVPWLLLLFALPAFCRDQPFESGQRAYAAGHFAEAFLAFKEAAEAGDDRAFGRLGGMYLYAVGTDRSFDRAYLWFTLARVSGDRYAEGFQRTAASMLKPLRIGELQEEAEYLRQRLGKAPR
ncbi:MAG: sel1 repeat family protein [Gammaproteobacteria bacterium]|nr:sel1 repeat family protein [Gammaproteobacteria bacterium]